MPGVPGFELPGAQPRPPVVESLPPEVASGPPPSKPPSSGRWQLLVHGPQGFRLAVPFVLLAAAAPFVWPLVSDYLEAGRQAREATKAVATFQAQLDQLKQRADAAEKRATIAEKRLQDGEDWTGAVFSQALSVDVRRRDGAPALPALRITYPLRKANRIDPHAPLVTVETPQPTGD